MIWKNLFSKVILKNTEYNFYTFEIDIKNLFREKKSIKEFLIYNLEKQHPRFLSQCKWEYFFTLKNKKLMANVIVVDKLYFSKLIEEGKSNFYIEKPKKKIFPIIKKGFVAILVLTLCLIFGCAVSLMETSPKEIMEEIPKQKSETEQKNVENQIQGQFLPIDNVFSNLITSFTNENIFVSTLILENFPNKKIIDFTITGVYSEDIENFFQNWITTAKSKDFFVEGIGLKINSTKYESKELEVIPIVQGEIFQLQPEQKQTSCFSTKESQKQSLINLRNYLIENKIRPLEENLENGRLVFQVEKSVMEDFFTSYFFENTLILSSCKITNNLQEDFAQFDFGFFYQDGEDSFLMNNYFTENLFSVLEKVSEQKVETKKIETAKDEIGKAENFSSYEGIVIGKVRNTFGEESLLIKNPDGKIILK